MHQWLLYCSSQQCGCRCLIRKNFCEGCGSYREVKHRHNLTANLLFKFAGVVAFLFTSMHLRLFSWVLHFVIEMFQVTVLKNFLSTAVTSYTSRKTMCISNHCNWFFSLSQPSQILLCLAKGDVCLILRKVSKTGGINHGL